MTENEQIARWLGWKVERYDKTRDGYTVTKDGMVYHDLVDFRTSNEWAGAVLERLGGYGFLDSIKIKATSEIKWRCVLYRAFDDVKERSSTYLDWTDNWRSAVVDAALEVIRREFSAGDRP